MVGVHLLVYTLPYHTLGTPYHTLHPGPTGVQLLLRGVRDDGALGSNLEKEVGMRRREASRVPKV